MWIGLTLPWLVIMWNKHWEGSVTGVGGAAFAALDVASTSPGYITGAQVLSKRPGNSQVLSSLIQVEHMPGKMSTELFTEMM